MKPFALICIISLGLLGAGSSHAASSSALTGSTFGHISIHWQDHQPQRHYRGHRQGHSGHHLNRAVHQRQSGYHRSGRAVNGYRAAYRRPCEHVTIQSHDRRGRPISTQFKQCYDARGHAFEVPGSRIVYR